MARKPESFPFSDLFPAAAGLLVLEELESMHKQVPIDALRATRGIEAWSAARRSKAEQDGELRNVSPK